MKKILLANHLSDSYVGGAELLLLWLSNELSFSNAYDPVFLSNKAGKITEIAGNYEIEQLICGYDVCWDLLADDLNLKDMVHSFLDVKKQDIDSLKDLFISHEIDLVISNCIINVLPAVAAKQLGIPVIWLINEVYGAFNPGSNILLAKLENVLKGHKNRSTIAAILKQFSDFLIFPSYFSYHSYNHKNALESKSAVIHPPVRPELYQDAQSFEKNYPLNSVVVGFAGLHVEHKGIIDFIRAAKDISEKNAHVKFLLCGGAPSREFLSRLMHLIEELDLTQHVQVLGFLENMSDFYRKVDILIMPSRYQEPFGMVTLEALCYGICVILYRESGASELIENNRNGFIIPPDSREITKAVFRLIDHPQLYKSISVEARRTALRHVSPAVAFQKYCKIFETILDCESKKDVIHNHC